MSEHMVHAANELIHALRVWRHSKILFIGYEAKQLRHAIDIWETAYAIELDIKAAAPNAFTPAKGVEHG
jgi:hypothetical protein